MTTSHQWATIYEHDAGTYLTLVLKVEFCLFSLIAINYYNTAGLRFDFWMKAVSFSVKETRIECLVRFVECQSLRAYSLGVLELTLH